MKGFTELAARYGTPLYVYDLDRLVAARRDLLTALPKGIALFYSLKANPHPELAAALRLGDGAICRAEISSTGELAAALAAGYPATDCLYTGPGKTAAELTEAIARGVRLFSAESCTDLRRIGLAASAQGVVADCLLRINSAAASGSTSIRMTGKPSQFGIDSEAVLRLMPELIEVPGTRLMGAHFFTMSNAVDEDSLIAEFRHTITTAAQLSQEAGLTMRLLNIGGGFGAPYAVPGARPTYDKLRTELGHVLDAHFPHWQAGEPRVACESGRYLTGDSGHLICTVLDVKESRDRRFVVLDGGINAFGGMSGLGRLLPVAAKPLKARADRTASLVGPLCTPGDVLGREVNVPEVGVGDIIAIPNTGAYGVTASLTSFLSRTPPVEVVVRNGDVVSVSRLDQRRVTSL